MINLDQEKRKIKKKRNTFENVNSLYEGKKKLLLLLEVEYFQ